MPAAVGRLRGSPLGALVTVTVALFTDGFLYGVLVPLSAAPGSGVAGEWLLGLLYGAYAVGVLVSTPVLGVVSDRIGRRRPLLLGLAGQAAATALFGTAAVPTLLLARLLQGVASAATWTAGLALVAEQFPEHRARRLGLVMAGYTGGFLLGPVAGGVLVERSPHLPLLVVGVLLAIDGALRVGLLAGGPPPGGTHGVGLARLLRDRAVLGSAAMVALGAAGWSLVEPLLPSHLERSGGLTPAAVGAMFTLSTLAYGVAGPPIGHLADRWGNWRTMTLGALAMAATLPLLARPTRLLWATGALVLVNVAYGLLVNPIMSELADAVDRTGRAGYASVYAIYNIAYSVGTLVSGAAGGALASALSFQAALCGVSLLLLATFGGVAALRRGSAEDPAGAATPAGRPA
jgi:MFS family permease